MHRLRKVNTTKFKFSSVQSLSCVQLFATPWTAAHQASLSLINSWSLFKLMSFESDMPSLCGFSSVQPVQSLSRVQLFATPWTAAHQASLSITNSQSLLKLMSIEPVIPSNHLILCRPLLFLPSVLSSIRVFSNESALHIRWPKYWNFSFSISPSNEYSGVISFRIDWLNLLAV